MTARRIMALRLSVLLILSLLLAPIAAASGAGLPTHHAAAQAPETKTTLPTTATTITFWNPDAVSWQPTYEAIIAEFNKLYPDIQVNMVNVPEDGFQEKLTTAIAGGNPPDVWVLFDQANEQLDDGRYEPLTTYLEADGVDVNQWFQPLIGLNLTYEGTYYAVPRDIGISALLYNQDLFEQAGVTPPTGGWTLDDFKTISAALTNEQERVYGSDWGQGSFFPINGPIAWNAGADVLSEDGRQAEGFLNSDNMKRFLSWAVSLQHDGVAIPPTIAEAVGGDAGAFATGNIAMDTTGLWGFANVKKAPFQMATLPFPTVPGQESYSWSASVGYSMAPNSDHKNEAWAFMKFMSGPTAGMIAARDLNWAPPLPSVWEESGLATDPVLSGVFAQRNLPARVPAFARTRFYFECVNPQIDTAMGRALRTKEEIGPLLDEAAKNAQSCLDRNYAEGA